MKITICTPTYNRASYLERVYASILGQQFDGVEWVIVDDGSTDGTAAEVARLRSGARLEIVYLSQPNQGKHVAVNAALDVARGELFWIIDSDDLCAPAALQTLWTEWQTVRSQLHVAGMTCLNMDAQGATIGSRFSPDRIIETLPVCFARQRIRGDKCDLHRTAILRAHRFPQQPGEKFCPESLVWNRIAQHYMTYFFNYHAKIVEYLPQGLSANSVRARARSPLTAMQYYHEMLAWPLGLRSALRSALNYLRFACHAGQVRVAWRRHPLLTLALLPLGAAFWLKDRRHVR